MDDYDYLNMKEQIEQEYETTTRAWMQKKWVADVGFVRNTLSYIYMITHPKTSLRLLHFACRVLFRYRVDINQRK